MCMSDSSIAPISWATPEPAALRRLQLDPCCPELLGRGQPALAAEAMLYAGWDLVWVEDGGRDG